MAIKDAESVIINSRQDWRKWLKKNHARKNGIWLVHNKGPQRTISYDDIVEEALCFGWIDSILRRVDDAQTMLYIAPRKPKSIWAQTNKTRVERLIKEGKMTPTGLAKVEAAKKDGSWSSLDDIEKLVTPDTLDKALNDNPTAKKNFNNFSQSYKKQVFWWVTSAKRPETKDKRIREIIRSSAKNIKIV